MNTLAIGLDRKMNTLWAGKMAQQVKLFIIKLDNSSLLSIIHVVEEVNLLPWLIF